MPKLGCMFNRLTLGLAFLALGLLLIGWIVSQGQLPPADFTFNNSTDIKSLDPAVVTGQPEGRIIMSLYEGLVRLGPRYREPQPGMAKSWEISEDGKTYTFHLREGCKWSNGDPVTADDFVYSMQRFLSPSTTAEYAYQAWYLKNARKFSRASRGVEVGDPVEVELFERVEGSLPFAPGKTLRGKLIAIEPDPDATEEELADDDDFTKLRTFVVEIEGKEICFRIHSKEEDFDNATACKQLTLDFREVGIRAPDAMTVVMDLEAPTPYWLQLLGFYPLSPVNRTCVETYGKSDWAKTGRIVTNGAYKLQFRRIRDRIRIVKNPDYWDAENVEIETIDALMIESLTTAFNMYETGQIDWQPQNDPLISKELLKLDEPRDDFNPQPQFGTYFYAFNVTRPPLDDVRVRQALVMAIDRQQIVDVAGAGEVTTRSFVPPGLPGYTNASCFEEDVARAKELLAEAGYPDGVGFPKISLLYNYQEQHQTIAELLRKQWQRNLGINVSTRNEEWGTYLSSQRTLKFDAIRRAWIGDYLDPNTFLDMFVTNGENNKTGWSNEQYDKLIEESRLETDAAKRLKMLNEAEAILMEELPIMPIYNYVSRNLVRNHIQGFWNNLQDTHPLQYMKIDRNHQGPSDFMVPITREVTAETTGKEATE